MNEWILVHWNAEMVLQGSPTEKKIDGFDYQITNYQKEEHKRYWHDKCT